MTISSASSTTELPQLAGPHRGRPVAALALVLCAQLMVILDLTIVNVALPSIEQGLHFSATGLSWVLNAYALTFGGLLLLDAGQRDVDDGQIEDHHQLRAQNERQGGDRAAAVWTGQLREFGGGGCR